MTGLRERNKALRVAAILDAAVQLLDEQPLGDVTTEQIAYRARVSPATVYNLVGTRDRLLHALLDRVVEDLVEEVALAAERDDDPIAVAHLIVDHSVAAFTSHSRAYRQIVAAGRSIDGDVPEPSTDPSELQVVAFGHAQELGVLRDDVDPAGLGRQIYISWIGAMEHWANGKLDDSGFGIAARHGLLVVLAASAVEGERGRFLDELRHAGTELDRRWAD